MLWINFNYFFSISGFGKKGKGKRLAEKRVGGKVEINTVKAKDFLRGALVWLQPLVSVY